METKELITARVQEVGTVKGANSMGISESFYNPYYLIKRAFTLDEIHAMSEAELQSVFKMADYATEVFY
jgi:hypothetical protein